MNVECSDCGKDPRVGHKPGCVHRKTVVLSETQVKVMRYIRKHDLNDTTEQIAGHGRAPWLSACRALVRRGLARTWRSGYYGLTDAGREALQEHEAAGDMA